MGLVAVTRGLKVWVFVCLCSLLIWLICLRAWGFFGSFLNVMLGLPDLYVGNLGMFLADGAGLFARCIGVVVALAVAFVVWGGGRLDKSTARVERLVEAVLFLEGTYFVLLFPSGLWRISSGLNFLGVAYLLQAASAGAALLFLSFKVRGSAGNVGVLKYVGLAAVGYVGALWFNVVFKWFDMIGVLGSSFLLRGSAAWGFLGSLITMTLAVIFAAFGAYYLAKNRGEAVWWFGFSLMLIGVHYVIYMSYAFLSSNLDFALPMDVWTVPFIGLGVVLLRMKASKTVI